MNPINSTSKKSTGFTDEEKAAVKARVLELKAEAARLQGQGGRRKGRACGDRRNEGTGSLHCHTAPCDHKSKCTDPHAENLVRLPRLCQGWQDRLLLPICGEVQHQVRRAWLQRCGKPR